MNTQGKGKKMARYQGRCSGRTHQEEGHVDQSSPDPRGVTWTPGCWSQMLSSLPPTLLLLLALVMMAMRMRYWDCVGRIIGTQPREEVGAGQMMTGLMSHHLMTPGQPVGHDIVMSVSCANDTNQTWLVCDKHGKFCSAPSHI